MRALTVAIFVLLGVTGSLLALDESKQPAKKTAPGKLEEAPKPRAFPEEGPVPQPLTPPRWNFNPQKGEWIDPEGTPWKFDGLRWRVRWMDKHWYPVIPPGPLPPWQRSNLGKGWSQVLPPGSSTWHIVPPTFYHMPPPFRGPPLPPPPPYAHTAGYRGARVPPRLRHRWRQDYYQP